MSQRDSGYDRIERDSYETRSMAGTGTRNRSQMFNDSLLDHWKEQVRDAVAAERKRCLEIVAEWANQEGISFDATTRLSIALGLEK